MTTEEFFAAVKQMRFAQIKYFRTRNKDDFLSAKSLEKMVNGWLAEWQHKRFMESLKVNA